MLDVKLRRSAVCDLAWRLDSGKRLRGFGLTGAGDSLAASMDTGGRAYGLAVFQREGGAWRGRWLTSIDGASALGAMSIEGDPLAGRHRFTGRGPAGAFAGSVTVTARGPAYALNFNGSSGLPLYRGIGVLDGDRLAVAWSFGSSPALALYSVTGKSLEGRRYNFPRGQPDAAVTTERLTREGADDTIFPPLLPTPPGAVP